MSAPITGPGATELEQLRALGAEAERLGAELAKVGPDELWDRIDGKIFDWFKDYADGYSREDVAKRYKKHLKGVAKRKLVDKFTAGLFSHVEK